MICCFSPKYLFKAMFLLFSPSIFVFSQHFFCCCQLVIELFNLLVSLAFIWDAWFVLAAAVLFSEGGAFREPW